MIIGLALIDVCGAYFAIGGSLAYLKLVYMAEPACCLQHWV